MLKAAASCNNRAFGFSRTHHKETSSRRTTTYQTNRFSIHCFSAYEHLCTVLIDALLCYIVGPPERRVAAMWLGCINDDPRNRRQHGGPVPSTAVLCMNGCSSVCRRASHSPPSLLGLLHLSDPNRFGVGV